MAVKDIVKGICETSKCNYDVYTSEKVDELLDDLVASNRFAVLEGTLTLEASESSGSSKTTQLDIEFPEGFNRQNCICLCVGASKHEDQYSYGIGLTSSLQMVTGSYPRYVTLGTNSDNTKIRLSVSNPSTTSASIYYKIVLMKIN